jgi:hypothetical protein
VPKVDINNIFTPSLMPKTSQISDIVADRCEPVRSGFEPEPNQPNRFTLVRVGVQGNHRTISLVQFEVWAKVPRSRTKLSNINTSFRMLSVPQPLSASVAPVMFHIEQGTFQEHPLDPVPPRKLMTSNRNGRTMSHPSHHVQNTIIFIFTRCNWDV